jgi:hypothetical protein
MLTVVNVSGILYINQSITYSVPGSIVYPGFIFQISIMGILNELIIFAVVEAQFFTLQAT